MNNVDYLVNKIKQVIPMEILKLTFSNEDYYGLNIIPIPIENQIKDKIIYDIVGKDISMVGGIEQLIDISNIGPRYVTMGMIYDIGMGPTGGKRITSVLSVSYGWNALSSGAASIASAVSAPLQTSDARVELIGLNVAFVMGYSAIQITNLRCILEYSKGFDEINPRSMVVLSDLAILATKAYIYTNLSIKIRNAVVTMGKDMSKIESYIDDLKDSFDMYTELLTKRWQKVSILNDAVTKNRIIRMTIPG